METTAQGGTQTWQIVVAWLFVGIPLLAGVTQTLINAMQLFIK